MNYFGTDGIRGLWGKELTEAICYKVGYGLASLAKHKKIILGHDTRPSCAPAKAALINGAINAGCYIEDAGILPTPAISYLTKTIDADYGVVISASHNPKEYNGIKIFNSEGFKLTEEEELAIETEIERQLNLHNTEKGKCVLRPDRADLYKNHLLNACTINLKGLKIVLDTCFGASYFVAPEVFKMLGAKIIALHSQNRGQKINVRSGALHPEVLVQKVKQCKADVGFAFDGDADRVIAVDEKGMIADGDKLLLLLANFYKKNNLLEGKNIVVGTVLTNLMIEKRLNQSGITLHRTNVGDKYILRELEQKKLKIGAEPCGHIILRDYVTSGDGILSAIVVSKILCLEQKPLSQLTKIALNPQLSYNITTDQKDRIMASKNLAKLLSELSAKFGMRGRAIVRPSGTEPLIRIMVEHPNKNTAQKALQKIVCLIEELNQPVVT